MHITQSSHRRNRPHMTRHALDVVSPLGEHLKRSDCQSIITLPGIDTLICDMDSGHMDITYDLNMVHLDVIEDHLMRLGYVRKRDIFHQLRNDLAHFFERNELRV
jgi:hypothetical protein